MNDKNNKIRESLANTRAKRSGQRCVVYKFKINESKLSKKQKIELKMMFVEGKWLYNYIVGNVYENKDFDLFKFNPLMETVVHKNKDGSDIESEFKYLPSSVKQTITKQIISSLKTIKTLRTKGYQKYGKLNFISELKSINLKQYGVTHEIRSSTTMKLQGVSKLVKVSGIQQMKNIRNIDFANANILNTPSGYYVALTCYADKDLKKIEKTNGKTIGIDFGCQTSLTYSDGTKQTISFEESDRLKLLQRKLSRKTKKSNRRDKLIRKIGKQYQHISNKKMDMSNKIVHNLKQYDKVIIQDEQLSRWMKCGHGKKISHGCLGIIKSKLKNMGNVVVLNKYIPTSKLCTNCGHIHSKLTQYDRTFVCPSCGSTMDRDIHAAQNMVWIYENLVGRDTAEFTLKEFRTSMSTTRFVSENKFRTQN